ncbi:MFS transporter [Paraburkholderia ginsengiterrae]|uniref:MFS transporter n=1 Tax=Paraburkholderia ginsengiterrae TaxID=1462993 RepID=A0A1A9N865_9BURK|nr:MFS transporter [Paraburkholderia ginsengiterrae]OAJ54973.1 MFS transporter [Paraburkholderia ginsengiterrae]OAJ61156.1 MFS transporter [Paraburkholderia ginsengiterrae]
MSALFESEASAVDADSRRLLRDAYLTAEWRIIPLLFGLWMLAWVDRANVAFAKLQMLSDLHFSETAYGLGAGLFFLGYVVFSVPSSIVQQRTGARLLISMIAIGWGATSVAMMFVKSTGMFYFLRFLLGVFEAGFYPGVILYFNQWFPAQRRTRNFSIFHSAAVCSTVAVSLSGGFVLEHMSGTWGLAGWRWMFLLQAIPTVLLGVVALFALPDGPATAGWLSDAKRRLVLDDLARDRGLALSDTESSSPVVANSMLWMLSGIYFCILAANTALGFFTPTILHEAGFGGYSAVGNAVAAICILGALGNIGFSMFASRYRDVRWHCAIAALVTLTSLLILVFVWHSSRTATFVTLVFGIAGTGAGVSLFWQLPARFMRQNTLALGVPIISSVANIAGFLTPWMTGYLRDVSGSYASGFLAAAGVEVIAVIALTAGIPFLTRRQQSECKTCASAH